MSGQELVDGLMGTGPETRMNRMAVEIGGSSTTI
jgi:hypothetical protein